MTPSFLLYKYPPAARAKKNVAWPEGKDEVTSWSISLLMLSKTLDTVYLDAPKGILDVLVETNLASSKREARTFIQSGAILLNDQKVNEVEYVVSQEISMHDSFIIVRRGKKKYAMIIFK